jgi:hypothetical protein
MNTYPIIHEGRTFVPDGEIPTRRLARLNCGHAPAPVRKDSIAPGYALRAGYTLCYACAGEWERADFAAASAYTAYLPARGGSHVLTYTGTALARITERHTSPPRYTPTGGWYRVTWIRAVAPDGTLWWGRSTGDTCTVNMRRVKARRAVQAVRAAA